MGNFGKKVILAIPFAVFGHDCVLHPQRSTGRHGGVSLVYSDAVFAYSHLALSISSRRSSFC